MRLALSVIDGYTNTMVILETPIFTRQITDLISDESCAEFQQLLCANPDMGKIIRGSGGLRKIRWRAKGSGKRGGIRVIYYWYVANDLIYMLFAYEKNKQSDLSPQQVIQLKSVVEEEFN